MKEQKAKVVEILQKEELTKLDLTFLMRVEDQELLDLIYQKAYEIKEAEIGKKVYYRGLIEFGNGCIKDCYYCGIRKSNSQVERFQMTKAEILASVDWIYNNDYGSIALQSGERQDKEYIDFVEEVLKEIKVKYKGELGVTISLGEQSEETYKRWFDAGAQRYLLRIETSSEALYSTLHPEDRLHNHKSRIECLKALDRIGYQVGTGVMIGLPHQSETDLVEDIIFYKENDIDMIGMGPYIPHHDTPMGRDFGDKILPKEKRVELSLKMIALTRIYLRDVNIAATTALQGLDALGREKGLKAGANILMPITTNLEHRAKYQLYDGKPCIDDTVEQCKGCLAARVSSVGDNIGYGEWGNSPHHKKKLKRRMGVV